MDPETGYTFCKFRENCARDTPLYAPAGRLYSEFWSNLSKNFSFGVPIPTLIVARMGVKSGTEEWTFGSLLRAKFHSHRCNVLPLWGEKPQNRPLSNLYTGALRCAQCCPCR